MTTTTAATPALPRSRPDLRVTQARVLLSEWTKLRSLRSTVYALVVAVVFVVGLAALVTSVTVAHWPPRDPAEALTFDPTSRSLVGVFLAQLAIGSLGVLLMSGEYATGMIRASFSAVPRRLPVLWAKGIVFGLVTFALLAPAALGAFLLGQSILAGKHLQTNLGQPGVLRAVLGAALYLTVIGLIGLALGTLLRNTAAAISTLFGLLLVVPIIVRFLPTSVSDTVDPYLPSSAGQALMRVHADPTTLAPWTGFGVFCLYAVVLLAAAAVALRRRDA